MPLRGKRFDFCAKYFNVWKVLPNIHRSAKKTAHICRMERNSLQIHHFLCVTKWLISWHTNASVGIIQATFPAQLFYQTFLQAPCVCTSTLSHSFLSDVDRLPLRRPEHGSSFVNLPQTQFGFAQTQLHRAVHWSQTRRWK